jgi:tetratricopeptide (TPR) repeat protein
VDQRKELKLTLGLEPRRRLGHITLDDSEHLMDEVLEVAIRGRETGARISAISHAAYTLILKRDATLGHRLLGALHSIDDTDLTEIDKARLAVSWAIVHYNNRSIERAESVLTQAIDRLSNKGIVNLAALSVHTALANIKSAKGEYIESLTYNRNAFRIGTLIGNERACSRIAANVTMCLGRLGDYRGTIEWAHVARSHSPDVTVDSMQHYLFHLGVAFGMLGQEEAAKDCAMQLATAGGSADNKRLAQNSLFFCADILSIIGKKSEALAVAKMAISGELEQLQSKNSAGMYARWHTMVKCQSGIFEEASIVLNRLIKDIQEFDRLDQVEIGCAEVWFRRKMNILCSDDISQLMRELQTLPTPVSDQLRRMGFLDYTP